MKITLFTSELSKKNGWGRYSLELARAFKKSGHEVLVVCHKKNIDETEIKQIEILPSPLSYRWNYLLFVITAIRLIFKIRGVSQTTIFHCLVETYAPVSWFFSLLNRKKIFLTIHGSFGVKPLMYRWTGYIQKFVYASCRTKIFCVSRYTANRLTSKVEAKLNISVIPNGVTLNKADIKEKVKLESNVLLGVGAIKKRKGFHLVIEAIPELIKRFPNMKYWIVGDMSDARYLQILKERVEKLNLDKRIKFLGNISDEKLKELYSKVDLFILTPLSDEFNFEGFGLVYLEANSYGLPVVGMKDNGGEEAIDNGETGLLAEANDKESIIKAVTKILEDQNLYQNMSRQAIDWAKKHSWQIIANNYLSLYTVENEKNQTVAF